MLHRLPARVFTVLAVFGCVLGCVLGCDDGAPDGSPSDEPATQAAGPERAGPPRRDGPVPSDSDPARVARGAEPTRGDGPPAALEATGDQGATDPSVPTPMPLAVGQWTRHRYARPNAEPSEMTYKVVGEDDDAWWIEVDVTTDEGRMTIKMLVAFTDAEDPSSADASSAEVRDVILRAPSGEVQRFEGALLRMTRRMYGQWASSLRTRWEGLEQEDVRVEAGAFRGSFRRMSETEFGPFASGAVMWHHSSVPIMGLVKSRSEDAGELELVAYGLTGAESTLRTPDP
jgi:hypothetical protein